MDDTTPLTATSGTDTTTEPQTGDIFINPDGTYKEGWKEALLPEDLRQEKFYDSPFNANFKELLKTAGNQAKMLGKKGVVPLTENSNEFEIKEWRKAHNVPDKYNYQKPTDLQIIQLPDEFIDKTLSELNAANLNHGQFDTVMKIFHDFWKGQENEYNQSEQEEINKVNQQILAEENTNYETNSHYVDNAVKQFTQGWTDEDIQTLFGPVDSQGGINSLEHIGLKPLLRKFLVNVGKGMGEHRMLAGDVGGKSLHDQLDEVMKSEAYTKGIGKEHTEAINKALKLREQINQQVQR